MKQVTDSSLSISGYCLKCQTVHSLTSLEAVPYCRELMDILEREKRIDFLLPEEKADEVYGVDYLFGDARGQMFGVMVYLDEHGVKGTARAFSGQYNGRWNAPGWVSPILDEAEFHKLTDETERRIKVLGREMQGLLKGSDEHSRLANSRRELSRRLMRKIHDSYNILNFCGGSAKMPEIASTSGGLPTGTGDCCAPKLLNHAVINGLTPLSIAEFYFGRENRSHTRAHRQFYSSCADKCGLILGFMLCGL